MTDQIHQAARENAFFMRFVPHDQADAYKALGWIDCAPNGGRSHHAVHSRLMKWEGPNPLSPENAERAYQAVLDTEEA